MDSQLQSISKIFTEKLYRIPDYQRGYAWTEKQLKDYWGDILQLEEGKNHYVGVLTLERVPSQKFMKWEEDSWIIKSKSFEPYYVVDGQQRLTTTIILIQAISESVPSSQTLNYTSAEEIRKRYIYDSKDGGISRSYIFGYEKDNPSSEFLKIKIFQEHSTSGYNREDTIYTHNLEFARQYFLDKIKDLKIEEIEEVYKKVTQNLLFNIYTISSDIDVFIAFETMNNRGKPLSNLELLKNRLIYLSTKFEVEEEEKEKLRTTINDSWKGIYHHLGKNKEKPLDDDLFLRNHFVMYFGKEILIDDEMEIFSRRRIHPSLYREDYIYYLLERKFTAKGISDVKDNLSVNDVYTYAESLQKSVMLWYDFYNPTQSKRFDEKEKYWLEKLSRIRLGMFSPLLLTFYLQNPDKSTSVKLLTLLEKFAFISVITSHTYVHPQDFHSVAHHLASSKSTINEIIKAIEERINHIISHDALNEIIKDRFRRGFYEWEGIRYFLFEYEQSIKEQSKTNKQKIDWVEFCNRQEDFITVEHIYPQTAKAECWTKHFKDFTPTQRKMLQNSLGNLLPLSKPKNSSLQNKCFEDKIDNKSNKVGFRFGSYSENEISGYTKWTATEILERGLRLLEFMEQRWQLNFGDRENKIDILNLKFLNK